MTNLFFAWVNFGITIFIGRYVYRRWIKDQLDTSIQKDKDKAQNLHIEVSQLENEVKELSVDLVLQENQAANLLNKLKLWQSAFNNDHALDMQNIANVQAIILQKNELKLKNLALNLAQKKILSTVLIEAGLVLQDKFEKKQEASLLLSQIVDELSRHSGAK